MTRHGAYVKPRIPGDKIRRVISSYLLGMGHKEVAREHGLPYTTCVDISKRYIKWVPVLTRSLPEEQPKLPLDRPSDRTYKDVPATLTLESEK